MFTLCMHFGGRGGAVEIIYPNGIISQANPVCIWVKDNRRAIFNYRV